MKIIYNKIVEICNRYWYRRAERRWRKSSKKFMAEHPGLQPVVDKIEKRLFYGDPDAEVVPDGVEFVGLDVLIEEEDKDENKMIPEKVLTLLSTGFTRRLMYPVLDAAYEVRPCIVCGGTGTIPNSDSCCLCPEGMKK